MMRKTLLMGTLLMAVVAPVIAGTKGTSVRLEARMLAVEKGLDASGKAAYHHLVNRNRRQFSLEVQGLIPGDLYDVSIAGIVVGTILIDEFGFGSLHFDDSSKPGFDEGLTKFPSHFPHLDGGELLVVGPLMGNLQPR